MTEIDLALEKLLEQVDNVIQNWSWCPPDEFGTLEAVISSALLIELGDAYRKYDDLKLTT